MAIMKDPTLTMTVEEFMRYYGMTSRVDAEFIMALERGAIDGDDVVINADGKIIRQADREKEKPR